MLPEPGAYSVDVRELDTLGEEGACGCNESRHPIRIPQHVPEQHLLQLEAGKPVMLQVQPRSKGPWATQSRVGADTSALQSPTITHWGSAEVQGLNHDKSSQMIVPLDRGMDRNTAAATSTAPEKSTLIEASLQQEKPFGYWLRASCGDEHPRHAPSAMQASDPTRLSEEVEEVQGGGRGEQRGDFEALACHLRGTPGRDLLQDQPWIYVPHAPLVSPTPPGPRALQHSKEATQHGKEATQHGPHTSAPARLGEAHNGGYRAMPLDELLPEDGASYWVHMEGDSTVMRAEKEELLWLMANGSVAAAWSVGVRCGARSKVGVSNPPD